MDTINIWALCGMDTGSPEEPSSDVADLVESADCVAYALTRDELPFGGWISKGWSCEFAVSLEVALDDYRAVHLIEAYIQEFCSSIPDVLDAGEAPSSDGQDGSNPEAWSNPFLPDGVMGWFCEQHLALRTGTLAANVDSAIKEASISDDEAANYASNLARQFLFVAAIRAGRSAVNLDEVHDALWFTVMSAVMAAIDDIDDPDQRSARVNELLGSLAELLLTRQELAPGRGIDFSGHEDLGLRLIIEKYGISNVE